MMLTDDFRLMLVTAVLVLLTAVVFQRVRRFRQWAAVIDKIPGPKGIPLFGIALHFFCNRQTLAERTIEMLKYYAGITPIMRIWLGQSPFITIVRVEGARALVESKTEITKASTYKTYEDWLGTGLLTSTGSKWHRRRKMITPSFHFSVLDKFLLVMNEQADVLVQILHRHSQKINHQQFDIYPFISNCALDIICETAMGCGVNAQSDSTSEYVNAAHNLVECKNFREMRPWLASDVIYRLSSLGRKENKCLKTLHAFTKDIIRKRRSEYVKNKNREGREDDIGLKRRVALLDMLLEHSEAERNGPALTEEDIREEVDTFVFAGHDTISVGISWSLYCIGQHPQVQQRIMEELDTVLGDKKQPLTREDLQQLKYLECVIKESHRLYPPGPAFGRRIANDMDICGYKVPAGCDVFVSIFCLHRDPRHYPEPEKFDPDRFLPENCLNRDPYAYIPFLAGPRNCIGQKFALMEEKVVLSQIFRNFKVTATPDEGVNFIHEVVLRPLRGIWVQLEPRIASA